MKGRIEEYIFFHFAKSPGEQSIWWHDTWWSRAALGELVYDCEKNLRESGFSQGQRLVLMLPNCPLSVALTLAVWRLGGTIIPVDPRQSAAYFLKDILFADVFAVVTTNENTSLIEELNLANIPCVGAPLSGAVSHVRGNAGTPESPETAVIFFTSGTTGAPKAVPVTHNNILSNVAACMRAVTDINDEDIFLNALPNYHTLGFTVCTMFPMLYGLPQVLVPYFMPVETTIETLRHSKTTVIPAVPFMLSMLVGAASRGAMLPTSLRLVICGGDHLHRDLAQRAEKLLGVTILEGYGLTEASPVVAVNASVKERRLGTVGKLLDNVRGEIRNGGGLVQPVGTDGRLWIHGDSVVSRYYRNEELSRERFVDGWFDTQDIARFDEDGYLTVVSRLCDVMVVGGFTVYAQEVEEVLREHPAVAEAAVVGIPYPLTGDRIKAFVVLNNRIDPHPTAHELIAFCRLRLLPYKIPRMVEFLQEMPRNANGDILKRTLKELS